MTWVSEYRPGGRTGRFAQTGYYRDFVALFRYEEQTALWNRGLGEEDIVRGLSRATDIPEADVQAWLMDRKKFDSRLEEAVAHWAAVRWDKRFPAYYAVVARRMERAHTAMGRVGAACLLKCMKMNTPPEYIVEGIRQGFSWQQVVIGAENGIAIEYLDTVVVKKEDSADEPDY